jgi:hypothetical protein
LLRLDTADLETIAAEYAVSKVDGRTEVDNIDSVVRSK